MHSSWPKQPERRRTGAMERHIQTILLALVTAAILSIAKFGYEAAQTFARLDERLNNMAIDLGRASSAIDTLAKAAETKSDHDTDLNAQGRVIGDHEARIRALENEPH